MDDLDLVNEAIARVQAAGGDRATIQGALDDGLKAAKNIRDSNIFSNIRITPSHCVAVTIAIDIRSAGKAGSSRPPWGCSNARK